MKRALILGGTGAIGYAVARRLLDLGWRVELTGRDPAHRPPDLPGASFAPVARDDGEGMRALLGGGAHLVVDCACYTARQAEALLPLLGDVGATVMISSKAVYVDAEGRHSNSRSAPRFDGPIREGQPTLAPSDAPFDSPEGYGANKAAAEAVLLESGLPVTVLRPSKVHGAWSRRPREWFFVKRVLDRRRPVVLVRGGRGVGHPSAAANIAALVECVAALPGQRVLNVADPDAPTALEMSRRVAAYLGWEFDEVLAEDSLPGTVGRHPWDAPSPLVLDTSAAAALGYRPVGTYGETVAAEVDWLVRLASTGHPRWALPAADDPFFARLFDYAAEDRYLRTRGGSG